MKEFFKAGLAVIFLCLSVHVTAQMQGGAFGIRMGQSLSSLTVLERVSDDSYVVKVPQPNPEFEQYMVRLTPSTGVCRVSGLGKTYVDDKYGVEARSAFDRIHAALQNRYGESKDYDFLNSGSIWNEVRDFHMSLLKKERTLASFWSEAHGSTLPASLGSVMLEMRAVDRGPYVTLSYEFANMDKCSALRDAANNRGL